MKTQTLKLFRDVVVTEVPLGKYVELLKSLDELPKYLDKLDGLKNEEIISQLPTIIAACINDFIKIIVVCTDLKAEELNTEVGIKGTTELVLAIVEVNDYSAAWDNIKKVLARPKKQLTAVPSEAQPKS